MCCEVNVGGAAWEVDAVGVFGREVHLFSLLLGHSREGLFSTRCCGDWVILFVDGVFCRVKGRAGEECWPGFRWMIEEGTSREVHCLCF